MPEQLSKLDRSRPLKLRQSTIHGLRLMHQANPRIAWTLAVTATALGTLSTAFAVVTGRLVDVAETAVRQGGLTPQTTRAFVLLLGLVGVVSIVSDVGSRFHAAYVDSFRQLVEGRRRERVMTAALAPAGIAHLEDAQTLDKIRMATATDFADTGHFALGVYGMVLTRVGGFCSALVVAVMFRWWVGFGVMALWLWAGRLMRLGQYEAWEDTSRDLRRAAYFRDLAFEPLAAKEVRIFGFAPWLLDSFSSAWHRIMREVWRRRGANRPKQVAMLAVVIVGNAIAYAIVANAARSGELSVAELVVVVPSMMEMCWLAEMGMFTIGISVGAIAMPPLVELEEDLLPTTTPATPMRATQHSPAGLPINEIVFEEVGFTYPHRDHPVYEQLDLRIAAGRSLAVVGANGAGKTTLVKLLTRLHEPTSGRITVDGIDVREFDARQWQRRVAAIFQDFVRYDLTAADNVAFGASHIAYDREAMERAATRVGALSVIEQLPHGWDTILTRRYPSGMDLSGGQWQRLALARALFALEGGAGVLVLDEPTASLDVRGEVEVFDKFLEVTAGATTIVISHRFSTVRRADRIVVLRHGRVAEDGTHNDLLARNGLYARAFRLQARRYHDGQIEVQ